MVLSTAFYVPTWERRFAGTFYLPWSYDFALLAVTFWYLFLGWSEENFKLIANAHFVGWTHFITVTFGLISLTVSTMQSFWRIYLKVKSDSIDRAQIYSRMRQILFDLIPHFYTAAVFMLWFSISPNNLGIVKPGLFAWCYAVTFAHIAFHMILTSLTNRRSIFSSFSKHSKFDM